MNILVKSYPILNACVSMCFAMTLCLNVPAHAADMDPFQVDESRWMSLNFYKESIKNLANAPDNTDKTKAAEINAPEIPPAVLPSSTSAANMTPTPEVAPPTRPLDIPVMPGMNKGYAVSVSSTASQQTMVETTPPVNLDDKGNFALSATNWLDAKEAAHDDALLNDDSRDSENIALKVRMSYLPDAQVTPAPSFQQPLAHGRSALTTAPHVTAHDTSKKAPAELASCAALDAYKKRQLEAIQSDRETLKALQAAIGQLGLQKQLNFIAGANRDVAGAEPNALTTGISLPVSANP